MNHTIAEKSGKVLNIIFLAMVFITLRIGYLTMTEHEEKKQKARLPQIKTVIERVERGTINDRFDVPLAINALEYQASIVYAPIRGIPRIKWIKKHGKKEKTYPRKEYVAKLCSFLEKQIVIPGQEIEDAIYAKASLFPSTPFAIKTNITEKEFYRLKSLERLYPGLVAERLTKRVYPLGKSCCDVVGMIGKISQEEYGQVAREIEHLSTYLQKREQGELAPLPIGYKNAKEVRSRLKYLYNKSYTIHDMVGKSGIEKSFDEDLRGCPGRKFYEVDFQGRILRQLPGTKAPVAAKRINLTISSELQNLAEQLLAEIESHAGPKQSDDLPKPWLRGGAIVCIEPTTGDVLALASYPRFDPSDFVRPQGKNVNKWYETLAYIGEIWDGKQDLEKEIHFIKTGFALEKHALDWNFYLEQVLSGSSEVSKKLEEINTVKSAFFLLDTVEFATKLTQSKSTKAVLDALYETTHDAEQTLKELMENNETYQEIRSILDPILSSISGTQDKLLLLDLCGLLIKTGPMTPLLVSYIGDLTLAELRELSQSFLRLETALKKQLFSSFIAIDFADWRKSHFEEYLKLKRKEEKEQKKYTRPYTEYLEMAQKEMFKELWQAKRLHWLDLYLSNFSRAIAESGTTYLACLLNYSKENIEEITFKKLKKIYSQLPANIAVELLKQMRSFDELSRPLLGKYTRLRRENGQTLEKHLAAAFYPLSGFGYARSFAFRQVAPQGSIFKLVTSYEALRQSYLQENNLDPLTLIDETRGKSSAKQILGFDMQGNPYHRLYKGGRLPGGHAGIGKIDIIGALEQSSNIYFSILAAEKIAEPSHLCQAAWSLGFGAKTGINLPGETPGFIPDDVTYNRTGLYSMAIGQHSLTVTPLQTAMMLTAFARDGTLVKPKIVHSFYTQYKKDDPEFIFSSKDQGKLEKAGIYFPLFSENITLAEETVIEDFATEIKRSLYFPQDIKQILFQGMYNVINGEKGSARSSLIRFSPAQRKTRHLYKELSPQMIGKTGTAEILYKPSQDGQTTAQIRNHTWFGGISFAPPPDKSLTPPELWEHPELVVVIYSRFGAAGKNVAPIMSELVAKWRELKNKETI